MPLNTQLTDYAWNAYDKGNYEEAISYAQECIDQFMSNAEKKQLQLEKENAMLPPTGTVTEQEKQNIYALGLLNDVATCYFIKGKCEEAIGYKEDAIKSYSAASKYTYARCWDPKGWFWSPSEAALDRLNVIK
jgi:tetratricopeptide (TPR) repeat protein